MFEPPGVTRRPSLLLITPRGAQLLADVRGDPPWPYVQRAKDARDHCWHVVHDLEANGFFIDLVLASRLALREGLLRWVGEESCRANRRAIEKRHRRPIATPDGMGSYLFGGSAIRFDLEWDRGTASMSRLRQKVRTCVCYWKDTANADRYHVLFVLSDQAREDALRPIIRSEIRTSSHSMCHFSTTTRQRLEAEGPLGRLWCNAEQTQDEQVWPAPQRQPADSPRVRLVDLPPFEKSERGITHCVGRPGWWERRPGGGEVE
jgi:hypothetical protein